MLNVLLTLGALQVAGMVALLVRTKTLALMLGPEGVGVLGTVDKLLATVTQTVSFSLPFAALRFLPELWSQNPVEFAVLFRRMRNLLLVIAALTMIVTFLVTTLTPRFWGDQLLPYRSVLLCAFCGVPAVMFVPFLQNAIAGRLKHNLSLLFSLANTVLLTLAGVVGVWWNGLQGQYLLYALTSLMLVVPVMWFTERVPGQCQENEKRAFSIRLPVRVWTFGLALSTLAFIAPFAALYMNYQVLGVFGAETAGWMQAAIGIGLVARNLLGTAHPLYLTPNLNRGGTAAERLHWAGEFQRTFSFVCLIAVLPLVLFPRLVIELVYSANFVPGSRFVSLFVAAEVLTLLAGTYQALIVAFNHMAFHVIQNVIAQGVVLLLAFLVIKPYGIVGAGLAAVAAQLVLYAGSTLFLRWRYHIRLPLRDNLHMLYIVLSLFLAGLAGALDTTFSWRTVFWKALLFAVLSAGLTLFLTRKDRENISRFIRQMWLCIESFTVIGLKPDWRR